MMSSENIFTNSKNKPAPKVVVEINSPVRFIGASRTQEYIFDIPIDSDLWEEVDGKWRVKISQTMHSLKNVNSVIVEKQSTIDMYENIVYTYKRYTTGSISIILDKKINIKIVLKGDK